MARVLDVPLSGPAGSWTVHVTPEVGGRIPGRIWVADPVHPELIDPMPMVYREYMLDVTRYVATGQHLLSGPREA
jgi:hypothetical protein